MRILEGVGTLIQLGGLMARLCKMVRSCSALTIIELTTGRTEHKTGAFCHLVLSHCDNEVLLLDIERLTCESQWPTQEKR